MVETAYSPDRGDIIWISLDPTLGRELQKRRPALILTPKAYNLKTSFALIVPITSKVKGYSFEVALPIDLSIQGVILSDQIRSTGEVVMFNLSSPPPLHYSTRYEPNKRHCCFDRYSALRSSFRH